MTTSNKQYDDDDDDSLLVIIFLKLQTYHPDAITLIVAIVFGFPPATQQTSFLSVAYYYCNVRYLHLDRVNVNRFATRRHPLSCPFRLL